VTRTFLLKGGGKGGRSLPNPSEDHKTRKVEHTHLPLVSSLISFHATKERKKKRWSSSWGKRNKKKVSLLPHEKEKKEKEQGLHPFP